MTIPSVLTLALYHLNSVCHLMLNFSDINRLLFIINTELLQNHCKMSLIFVLLMHCSNVSGLAEKNIKLYILVSEVGYQLGDRASLSALSSLSLFLYHYGLN